VRPISTVAALLATLVLGTGCDLLRDSRRPVVLITVDTLRADHLGAYGSTLQATPRLDRLAAQSQLFTAAFATVSMTLPSLSSLMTSRYPEELGLSNNSSALTASVPTLAVWFAAHGYRTGAVVSNFVVRRSSGLNRGFEQYNDEVLQKEAVRGMPERTAPRTTRAAMRMLEDLSHDGQRFFLWVHYQDPHGPYTPPEGLRERFLPATSKAPDANRELPTSKDQGGDGAIPKYQYLDGHRDPAFYRAGYAGEIAHADGWIGRLINDIDARKLLDRALVIFSADHGESLGEDDYWFSHGDRITQPLVRVPLLIHGPGVVPGRRDDTVSLIDLFPTIAGFLKLPAPDGLRGRDLLAPDAARRETAVYITTLRPISTLHYGLIAHGYKYVFWPRPGNPKERLFLRDDDHQDLDVQHPDVVSAMRAELLKARDSLKRSAASEQKLSPEDEERMKSLGYVDGR